MPVQDMNETLRLADVNPRSLFSESKSRVKLTAVIKGGYATEYEAYLQHGQKQDLETSARVAKDNNLPKIVAEAMIDTVVKTPKETREGQKAAMTRLLAETAEKVDKTVNAELDKLEKAGKITHDQLLDLQGYGGIEAIRIAAEYDGADTSPVNNEVKVDWETVRTGANRMDRIRSSMDPDKWPDYSKEAVAGLAGLAVGAGLGKVKETVGDGLENLAKRFGFTGHKVEQSVAKAPEPPRPMPEKPPTQAAPEPAPKKDYSGLTVSELQSQIIQAEEGSPELEDLREEKRARVKDLIKAFRKTHNQELPVYIKGIITERLKMVTPNYYQVPLDQLRDSKEGGSFFAEGDPRLEGLYGVVFSDEVDSVLHKIYDAAGSSTDPVINKVGGGAIEDIAARLKKSQIHIGVALDNPVDFLKQLPATFNGWKAANRANYSPELEAAAENYYADREYEKLMKQLMISQRPEGSAQPPPSQFVALFREGRYGMYEKFWGDKVRFLSVLDEKDRKVWAYANMAAFSNGIIPSPEGNWKTLIDTWLSDLDDAKRLANATPDQIKGIEGTKKFIRSMMAISASARAEEGSAGSAAAYVSLIMQAKSGDLEHADTWAEFLLADSPDKYLRVVLDPLVKRYYDKLLLDAGVTVNSEVSTSDGKAKNSKITIEQATAEASKLVEYLKTKNVEAKGGFVPYIDEFLLANETASDLASDEANKIGDFERWSAARLACDAFLADKYTRWENKVAYEEGDSTKSDRFLMKPVSGWGGDPFGLVLNPSLLPEDIKRVYAGGDGIIMRMFDKAFGAKDIFDSVEKDGVEPIPASAVGKIKDFARWNDALWQFLGGSRAASIGQWSPDTLTKTLPAIEELLDQVYGGKSINGDKVGKEIVGAMIARIINTKALASTMETARPNLGDTLNRIFTEKEEDATPFHKVIETLWGRRSNSREGLLYSMAAERTGIIFTPNRFGAEKELNDAHNRLLTNDQTGGNSGATALQAARSFFTVVSKISTLWGGKR